MSDRRASITTIHFFFLSLSLPLASEEGIWPFSLEHVEDGQCQLFKRTSVSLKSFKGFSTVLIEILHNLIADVQ